MRPRLLVQSAPMSDGIEVLAKPKHPAAPRIAEHAFGKLCSMPLDPTDGFVLSWIDGHTLAHDIVDVCGLDAATVTRVLSRLTALGLIEWGDVKSIAPPSMPAAERGGGRVSGTRVSTLRNIDTIAAPTREMWERFEQMTHYQLLDVDRQSDISKVEQAHAHAANLEAGTPAARMAAYIGAQRVLERVAVAYDALRSPESRRRYDEYLLLKQETRAIEDALAEGVHRASLVPVRADSSMVATTRESRKAPLRSRSGNLDAEHLVSALREHAPGSARRTRAEGLIRDAVLERKENNLVGATNALRLASSIISGCEALDEALDVVPQEMSQSLASTFREQAMKEESLYMWEQAAESWKKVLRGDPTDARAARGVAEALLEAGGSLELARRYAEDAVANAPDDASCHRTLARVYIALGMAKEALQTLHHAQSLGSEQAQRDGFIGRLRRRWRSA